MTNETALTLIPLLPLAGFVIGGLFGKRLGKRATQVIACAGPALAFMLAVKLFLHLLAVGPEGEAVVADLYTWIRAGDLEIGMKLLCDPLTSIMLLIVTGVGSLIHVYSTEYMHDEDDGGYARYFAYLNLFTAMMLVLVTGASLPVLFVGWEGVGLCSYLLIGFWYEDLGNVNAGRKAFVVNRVGDFGFLLGMFVVFWTFGTLDFQALAQVNLTAVETGTITLACLLLFVGATGKSAQVPLYVWLPDAMAGPTPVSALIHAATMVTAGVYMVARMGHLFSASPVAQGVVAGVGALTAFVAATMALSEFDLKKVLAYSTVSQLGYMFIGVGSGAYATGIFHLTTHAFFKALLFLGAGAVMHAFHHMDMRKFGGLKEKMPLTFGLFMIGALALAGIPPFSGFFSKDELLGAAFAHLLHGGAGGVYWGLIWLLGLVTAGLTAFYTFRAVTMTFFGESRGPFDDYAHAHDPGKLILVPLGILAVLAALGGFLNWPEMFGGHAWLTGYLAPVLGAPTAHGGAIMWVAVLLTTAISAGSAYLAFWVYSGNEGAMERFWSLPLIRRWHAISSEKYRIDARYERALVIPIKEGAVSLWRWVDVAVIDAAVNGVADVARGLAEAVRRTQAGFLGQYLFYMAGGAILLLVVLMGSG